MQAYKALIGCIISTCYLFIHYYIFDTLEACYKPYNRSFLLYSIFLQSYFICCLLLPSVSEYKCRQVVEGIELGLSYCMPFFAVIAGYNSLKHSDKACIPSYVVGIDRIVLTVSSLMLVLYTIPTFIHKFRMIREYGEVVDDEDVREVYSKILNSDFDLEEYIKKYHCVIEKEPFTQNELAILEEQCSKQWNKDQYGLDEDELEDCVICRCSYEVGDSVILHPRCGHKYHLECMSAWLTGQGHKESCPVCRVPTRRALMRHIRKKAFPI